MTPARQRYTQVGLELSLYSGKTRSYLIHKRIPFTERGSNLWEFNVTFPRKVGAAVVPVVISPDGEYLGDTSCIIDTLEARFPERPVLPATPVLRFAAYLFELWGDEFWLPLAMHTRWSHREENVGLFIHDIGEGMLAGFPQWIKNRVGLHYANLMNSYLPPLGVTAESRPLLDRFLEIQLDGLDRHFRDHRFLFGNRPSLGDYGMIAPLYAHVGRDPWSRRELIEPRKNLQGWIARMFDADSSSGGDFQPADDVPETLQPALRSIFKELPPFIQGCADAVRKTPILPPTTRKARRFFKETVRTPMAGGALVRQALSYPVWMAQRAMDALAAMSPSEQQQVRNWLVANAGDAWLKLDLPRVARVGVAAARVA